MTACSIFMPGSAAPSRFEHVIAQADRNRRRMRETDPERRRALLRELQQTAATRGSRAGIC